MSLRTPAMEALMITERIWLFIVNAMGIHCTFLILKDSSEICVAKSRQMGRVKIDQLKAEEVQAREKDANNTDFVSHM